jgi:hypothetical protein
MRRRDVDIRWAEEHYGLDKPAVEVETAEGERFGPEDDWDSESQERLKALLNKTLKRVETRAGV